MQSLTQIVTQALSHQHWKVLTSVALVIIRILGIVPIPTCTCKRSFSSTRRVKNYTCSTTVAERLNGIALMHFNQEIIPDTEKVIDLYAGQIR